MEKYYFYSLYPSVFVILPSTFTLVLELNRFLETEKINLILHLFTIVVINYYLYFWTGVGVWKVKDAIERLTVVTNFEKIPYVNVWENSSSKILNVISAAGARRSVAAALYDLVAIATLWLALVPPCLSSCSHCLLIFFFTVRCLRKLKILKICQSVIYMFLLKQLLISFY